MSVRTVSVALIAQVTSFVRPLGAAGGAVRRLGGELNTLGQRSPERLNKITTALGGTGLAMVALAGYAAKTAADFDKAMSHVDAVANSTKGELEQLRSAALNAGKTTSYTAIEAAAAEEELSKAGISVANILGGGLTGALNLAAAGSLDLAEAANIAAKAMNTFQLTGADVGHIADVLASSANKSATDVHEMGEALKMGGLAARNSGLSLEETVGVLSAFADRALVGSDAGTSLKTMLQFLAHPTEKAKNLMQDLGIEVYDTGGSFVGVAKVADILQEKLGTLTQEQRNSAFATIFGSDATRAATVLYELGADGVRKYVDAVNDTGAAAETARKKTDNLAGDIKRLRGTIESLAIEAGSGANGGLRVLVQAFTGIITSLAKLPSGVQSSIVVISALTGVTLLSAAAFLKMRATAQEMNAVIAGMGPAGARAATAFSSIAGWAGKLGLVGLAVGGIWLGMNAFSDWAEKRSAPVKADIDELTKSLSQFADTGKVAGELASRYGDHLQKLAGDVRNVRDNMANLAQVQEEADAAQDIDLGGDFVKNSEQAKQRISDLDAALTKLVQNGGATQARLALQQLRDAGKLTNDEFSTLVGMLPEYQKAALSANLANSQLAKGLGNTTTNALTMAGGLRAAIEAGQTLMDVFKQLNGAALSVSDAEIKAEQSARDLAAALKESHGSLDITKEKGAAAQSALNDLARSGAEAAQAVYDQSASVDEATVEFEKYRQKLIQALVASGMSKDAAKALADQYMKMPSLVSTRVDLYGTDNAQAQIQALKDSLARIPGSKTITITARAQLPAGLAMGALMRADGGTVDFYARGGIREPSHDAAIVAAGTYRVMGESETGGEGYVPLGAGKRAGAIATMRTINRRFGNPLGGGGTTYAPVINLTVNAGMGTNGYQVGKQVADALREYVTPSGGNVQQTVMRRQAGV